MSKTFTLLLLSLLLMDSSTASSPETLSNEDLVSGQDSRNERDDSEEPQTVVIDMTKDRMDKQKMDDVLETTAKSMGAPKRIVIYCPWIGYSHVKFVTTLGNDFCEAGHHVTIIDSLVNPTIKKTVRCQGIRSFAIAQNNVTAEILLNGDSKEAGLQAFWTDLTWKTKFEGFFAYVHSKNNFSRMLSEQCEDLVNSTMMADLMREERFDLAISEVFDFCGAFHYLKPKKIVLASSIPLHEFLGAKLGLPIAFDAVPTKFAMSVKDDHRSEFAAFSSSGFYHNAIESALHGHVMFGIQMANMSEIFQRHFPNETFPGFEAIMRSAHSLLENVHPHLDLSIPTLHAIQPIGGITVDKPKPLEEDVLQLLKAANEAGKQKVLVSFGTVMDPRTMTQEIMANMLAALGAVTEAFFLWKCDRGLLSEHEIPANVHVEEWLPQNDLLNSGDIDLFVSHMGIGSLTEAAYAGTPLVSVPIFVDQPYNFLMALRQGIARFVDKSSLSVTSSDLETAIREALKDKKMKRNSIRLADKLKKYGSQKKRMLEHIDFILSLDEDTPSVAFLNHHHGFTLMNHIRELVYLAPQYPFTAFIILICGPIVFVASVCLLLKCCGLLIRCIRYIFSLILKFCALLVRFIRYIFSLRHHIDHIYRLIVIWSTEERREGVEQNKPKEE